MQKKPWEFSPHVATMLGDYVYALQDPRDNKVFYIGKGCNDRVFSHFKAAVNAKLSNTGWTAKLRRIVEIWEDDLDVKWWIVRYNLQPQAIPTLDAFDVEAALIDLLEISQNGPALNDIGGHRKAARGILSSEDVAALAASAVNPKNACYQVFIFPIQNALAKGQTVYDATRGLWAVSQSFQNLPVPLAVGMASGVSKGVFEINQWIPHQASGKWEFTGADITNGHELSNTSWLTVIGAAIGFWQRGNYLIVEFDGNGQFRFLRGSANKAWQPL